MFDKCTCEGTHPPGQSMTRTINLQRNEALLKLGPDIELLSTETKQITTQDGTVIDRLLTVWGVRKGLSNASQPG